MNSTPDPVRIQRTRTKGWRMPTNTVYVGRPTEWGNSFRPGRQNLRKKLQPGGGDLMIKVLDAKHAVQLYRRFLPREIRVAAPIDLKGKDLACWCSLNQPCHADVLLKIANRPN